MYEMTTLSVYLEPIQWIAAIAFIPLVCWQYCMNSSTFCRWCALISGYAVQVGFFLLLDDVGFRTNLLILISSVAGYFWITTTIAVWPSKKINLVQAEVKLEDTESLTIPSS